MTKVHSPLFGESAVGRIGNIGTFRMGRHGPEFIRQAQGVARRTDAQARIRECFQEAKAAHSLIEPTRFKIGDQWYEHRIPLWADFWRQWILDHPECRA